MRNRLLNHIIDSVNKPNQWSSSEIIAAQAATIKRLSDAYELLHKEHNQLKQNYSNAWEYFNKVHEQARKAENSLPFWEKVINEVINFNKEVNKL